MSIRDKYKPTKTEVLKKNKEQEDQNLNSGRGGSDFLPVDEGLNKFRIFPKHEDEESFSHIRCYHWIPIEKDGEVKRTNVPNSRVHGGTEMDIIDEYIKYCRLMLDSSDVEEAKKLKDMVSFPHGLHMSTTWLVYANKIVKNKPDTFGLLELKKLVRDAMNELSIIEDENEAMETDPFTGVYDGKPILITYDPKPKSKKITDMYKTILSKHSLPLAEEELEKFDKVVPLSKLNLIQYTIVQFETALEGIRLYDEEQEINLFETDGFQEIIEQVKAQYDMSAGREVEESKPTKKTAGKKEAPVIKKTAGKKVFEPEPEEEDEPEPEVDDDDLEEADIYETMSRQELMKTLKGLDPEAKIFKSTTDESLKEQIRALVADTQEAEEEAEEEPEEEEIVEEKPKKAVKKAEPIKTAAAASGGTKLSLADIKNKLKKT